MKKKRYVGFLMGVFGFGLLTGLVVQANKASAQAAGQVPLAGTAILKYQDELPRLNVVNNLDGTPFTLEMREFQSKILPANTFPGYTGTWVWGYLDAGQVAGTSPIPSYIGPVVVAKRNTSTEITFVNNLGSAAGTNVLAYKNSTDQTLHWADPLNSEANLEAEKVATGGYAPPGLTYPTPADLGAKNYAGPIPAVVHLHGGEVPPVLDGGPDSWVTSSAPPAPGSQSGHGYYTKSIGTQGPNAVNNTFVYAYPNTQEPANIWFHDHTLGATRLNVYAGLAGGYVLLDPRPDAAAPGGVNINYPAPANLPTGRNAIPGVADAEHLIPFVIQDRMFDTNGQLFFPADSAAGILWTTNPEHPYWVPEFLGDVMVVNGKAWPTVGTALAPLPSRRYRFLFLNGSNARGYELFLVDPVTGLNGPPMWVIGTDGGYLDQPVKIDPNAAVNNKLVILPGERYDVIIDFNDPVYRASNPSGQLIMRNTARAPYPRGGTARPQTVGQIVKFFVGPATSPAIDASYNPASGASLRAGATAIERLAPASATLTRQLTLNEVMGLPKTAIDPATGVQTAFPGGPLEVLLNNTKWTGERVSLGGVIEPVPQGQFLPNHPPLPPDTPAGTEYYYHEVPLEGSTEVWEIINITADAHPIHFHLVQSQIISRQNFNVSKYTKAYAAAFPGAILREAYGPPYFYDNSNNPSVAAGSNIVGGNPNITPFLQGPAMAPLPQENGWKDTVVALPGQVTRVIIRWAPTDAGATGKNYFPFNPNHGHGYVWHCHIVDHEDNEMMRPNSVMPSVPDTARTKKQGTDY